MRAGGLGGIFGKFVASLLCQQAVCGRPEEHGLDLYPLSPAVFSEPNRSK